MPALTNSRRARSRNRLPPQAQAGRHALRRGPETPHSRGVCPAMPSRSTPRNTRRRYIILMTVVVFAIGGWSALWAYASSRAGQGIDDWRAHEAADGRIFGCGSQAIGGYPFRIEVACSPATFEFQRTVPPASVSIPRIHAAM